MSLAPRPLALAWQQLRTIFHSRRSTLLTSSLRPSHQQQSLSTSASSAVAASKDAAADKKSSTSTTSTSKEKQDPKVKKNHTPESKEEIGGPKGPEPTRYNDWEKNGRVSDF